MKFIILSLTLLALCTAGVCQVLDTQNMFNASITKALASQVELQNTIDNMPLDGDCRQYNACTLGSCDEVNACPTSGVGEAYNCLPKCSIVELQAINPYNLLNYSEPTEI